MKAGSREREVNSTRVNDGVNLKGANLFGSQFFGVCPLRPTTPFGWGCFEEQEHGDRPPDGDFVPQCVSEPPVSGSIWAECTTDNAEWNGPPNPFLPQ